MTDITSTTSPKRARRMAREPEASVPAPAMKAPSRVGATGWQQHSVRGAMAGALKKRGLVITSEKVQDVRRYRASQPA
jgi:hypothetical protein